MRDPALFPLYADIGALPGVGLKIKPSLERLIGGDKVLDLLFHLPVNWIDRRARSTLADAPFDEIATVSGIVDAVNLGRPPAPARIRIRDETGFMTLVYFRANAQWMQRTFKMGKPVMVSGRVEEYQGGRQMLHPDHVIDPEREGPPPEVEPVYPMTAGITPKGLRKYLAAALDTLSDLPEWVDPHLLTKKEWPGFLAALNLLHRPEAYDPDAFARARDRLAYDEALAREVAMEQARQARDRRAAPILPKALMIERTILEALPFRPTKGQMAAFAEISSELNRPIPMRRMIQGDVGSGKTLVAALAAAQAAAGGVVTAVMSPTEVLARQQVEAMNRFLAPAGYRCASLTGRDRASVREATLKDVRKGRVQVLSGTQALYQSDVELPDLGLVIIDEQHRFGVADRLKLSSKGGSPHMLVMSATPIPRTLALAFHGDLDISIIADKPANRQEVTTRAAPDTRVEEVMEAVANAVRRGERAFWICPTVDAEESGDASATLRRERLAEVAPTTVELVHGRMSPADRDGALERFRAGGSKVLVATTVIEVGVDVPEATIIVIERADKFGLAQLHQLRGRVGRGSKPSSCLLLYRAPLTDAGKERLDILRRTTDGFAIAEADFNLRGAGDLLGLRQSGAPDFRVLDPVKDIDLIEVARSDAKSILMGDPRLASDRGRAARMVRDLYAPRITSMIADARED
ncbi:ATP-dependent DNA helicase RecG [bacterium]|nr:ATP-dependent DNA helicase RecG [bacterium]